MTNVVSEKIIKKIENGPLVLFLGQQYLSWDSGKDLFLNAIKDKYAPGFEGDFSYKSLLGLNLSGNSSAVNDWIYKLGKSFSIPEQLKFIAKFPWSAVYTTSFDGISIRAFENEWRNVQPVADDRYKVINPRNKLNLHITYLNGFVGEGETTQRPPLNILESTKRKTTINTLLGRLPEITTPKGILVIDGFGVNDQLAIDDLAAVLYNLGEEQALLCNSDHLKDNILIQDLISSKKVVPIQNSFAQFMNELLQEEKIHFHNPDDYEYLGKWLTIHERRLKVPQDVLSIITKSATVLDDEIFDDSEVHESNEDLFRRFLSSSNSSPAWFGYPLGYAFPRDYHKDLKDKVVAKLKNNELKESPIIFHGQSSSGKTTSLGLLAYELRTEFKYPVLFIEKRYQKVDEHEIDIFCQWVENNGGKKTCIIWDGMLEPQFYSSLLNQLETRGRKVVLIGSSYTTGKLKKKSTDLHVIESPIELTASEKGRFGAFLKTVSPLLSTISNIISAINDRNFLALLYRYIPSVKSNISKSLFNELEFFTKILSKNTVVMEGNRGQLYEAFEAAGLTLEKNLVDLNQTTNVGNENLSLADQLIFAVMVPGKFGLNVPFELLLRVVGFESLSTSFFNVLNEINLIKWYEYNLGEYHLGPRTSVEAQIITSYLGDKEVEVAIIKLLLSNITASDTNNYGGPDYLINFVVELLNKVGPKSEQKLYDRHLLEFADELAELRKNNIRHPRLLLKEAFFLRELARKNHYETPDKLAFMDRAEKIVREGLEELIDYPDRGIKAFLKVELAAILGTKATELVKSGNFTLAKQTYETIREEISDLYAVNPENYAALDVIGWATLNLIENGVFEEFERINYETELANLLEIAEIEGVTEENVEDYNNLKLRFNDLIKNQVVADSTFQTLLSLGSASGFYLRAKSILGFLNEGDPDYIDLNRKAFEYLKENFDQIKADSKCLFLLFKCWWISKTKTSFFASEKQTLSLDHFDWVFCNSILSRLVAMEEGFSAIIQYIKAICEFHLEYYKESLNTFSVLESETDYSQYGKKRIKKFYLASNPDGSPKEYSGQVKKNVSAQLGHKNGKIFIPDLNMEVTFLLYDFQKNSFNAGDRIKALNIAFNFRGPIAIEAKSNV